MEEDSAGDPPKAGELGKPDVGRKEGTSSIGMWAELSPEEVKEF